MAKEAGQTQHECMDEMKKDANTYAGFGRKLREVRKSRALSQEDLAHLSGLDRTYISQCEAGKRNVTLRTLMSLAESLGIEPAELVDFKDDNDAP